MSPQNSKLHDILKRLDALNVKHTGAPAKTYNGNDLESLVAGIESVSQSLQENGALFKLAGLYSRLAAVDQKLTGRAAPTKPAQLPDLVDGVEAVAGSLSKKFTPDKPFVPASSSSAAPPATAAPAKTTAQPTPAAATPATQPAPSNQDETPAKTITPSSAPKTFGVTKSFGTMKGGENPRFKLIKEMIEKISNNDASVTEINLNNNDACTADLGVKMAQAVAKNSHLKKLMMVNCQLSTASGEAFAEALKTNKHLEVLHLESNNIASAGIKALADALLENTTLTELKLANQRQQIGTEAERSLAAALEKNESVAKLSLHVRDPGSRNKIDRAVSRNQEIARRKKRAGK